MVGDARLIDDEVREFAKAAVEWAGLKTYSPRGILDGIEESSEWREYEDLLKRAKPRSEEPPDPDNGIQDSSRLFKEAIQRANAGNALVPITPIPQPDDKTPRVQKWGDIEIVFISDERIQIAISGATETRNYAEMGFAKKNGKPKLAWVQLRDLAERKGVKRIAGNSQQWATVEKRMQEIRKVLPALAPWVHGRACQGHPQRTTGQPEPDF